MKLYIDTSKPDQILIKLDNKEFSSEARNNASQKLLPLIEQSLSEQGKQLGDITSIEVYPGPGSFTGLRVGGSIAQALAWSLRIPVNGVDLHKEKFIQMNYSVDNQKLLR